MSAGIRVRASAVAAIAAGCALLGAWPATADAKPKCTVKGNASSEELRGTPRADVICGRGGRDEIRGLGGADLIKGGEGPDTVRGGGANDRIYGQRENDHLWGGPGDDLLEGGHGRDWLDGQPEPIIYRCTRETYASCFHFMPTLTSFGVSPEVVDVSTGPAELTLSASLNDQLVPIDTVFDPEASHLAVTLASERGEVRFALVPCWTEGQPSCEGTVEFAAGSPSAEWTVTEVVIWTDHGD
ncbi:MAG TPA: calcium-binding protein, partial [Solirubrobacterales bacterium]|nr:calcium-binding protein [Solirubrobacterales bacterium]